MGGGAWRAEVHGVAKSRTRLRDFTFTFHFHALEKEMAIHSSVLAWRIPGTAEPGRLPSTGSLRVGHNWSDLAAAAVAGWLVSVSRYISLIMTRSYYNLLVQSFQCIWGYLGIISGEGNGKPLQYSCLENSLDRRAWQATVHEVARVGHDLVTKPPPPPGIMWNKRWRDRKCSVSSLQNHR